MASQFLAHLRTILAALFAGPIRVKSPAGDHWFFPAERLVLPVIAGADGEGEGDGDGGGSEDSDKADGAGDGADGSDTGDADGADDDKGGSGDGDEAGDGTEGTPKEPDWKTMSRKHERAAKKARKEAEETRTKLKEREDADKSEQEKAVDEAREAGRTEALTEGEKERRADRLEVEVTRLASKAIKVGEGDDAKTVKFADPEDAQIYLERAIAKGDIDKDDIFDESGQPQRSVIADALREMLEERPRLASDSKPGKPQGDADAGKGRSATKDMEDMTPEELFELKQKG